jgi:hypothetical protein
VYTLWCKDGVRRAYPGGKASSSMDPFRGLSCLQVRPIPDLVDSVVEDVKLLRKCAFLLPEQLPSALLLVARPWLTGGHTRAGLSRFLCCMYWHMVSRQVFLLRCSAPNIDPKLKIYGLLYSTDTGAGPCIERLHIQLLTYVVS